jgi:hypothetical protein
MATTERLSAAYSVLSKAAREGLTLSVGDLVSETGWAESTVRTYLRKQWESFVSISNNGSIAVHKEFLDYPYDVFARINSQKFLVNKDPFKPILNTTAEGLISKSRESALLAIQVYNNPTLNFRTPSFIVHMVIAYTSLLHAIFEEQGTDYAEKDQRGELRLTRSGQPWLWDLRHCIKEYWGGDNSPVRDNLQLFIELRDEIEHRYAPAFDAKVAEYCQALVLNYEDLMVQNFSQYYALGTSISIPLQLTRQASSSRLDALRELQRNDYRVLSELLDSFSASLPEESRSSMEFRFRIMLVQVPANHPESADLSMRFIKFEDLTEEGRASLRDAVTLVKTKTVQAANAGKLLPRAVVRIIQETEPRFRLHEHTQAWKYFGVRPREKQAQGCDARYCHYDEAHGDIVYTMEWVRKLELAIADQNVYAQVLAYRDPPPPK